MFEKKTSQKIVFCAYALRKICHKNSLESLLNSLFAKLNNSREKSCGYIHKKKV